MNNFKEFWISKHTNISWFGSEFQKYTQQKDFINDHLDNYVHVVEYAALESANAEITARIETERLMWNQAHIQEKALVALELENKKLSGTLEEIGADMYVGYKKSCGCGDAANKTLKEVE